MATRSAVLGRIVLPAGGGNATFITVPAGETWLVKQVNVHNSNVGAQSFGLRAADATGVFTAWFILQSVAGGTQEALGTWFVLDPGATVLASAAAGPFEVWVSGTKLQGFA